MPGPFWDTSALVKHYHPELGTPKVDNLLQTPGSAHVMSRLGVTETFSVFADKFKKNAVLATRRGGSTRRVSCFPAVRNRHHASPTRPESMTTLPAKSFCSRPSTRRRKSFHASVKRPICVAVTPWRSSLSESDRAWGVCVKRPTWWFPLQQLAPPRPMGVNDDRW